MPATNFNVPKIDSAAVDALALRVLTTPENSDLFLDPAAVIVEMAARIHQLRTLLHATHAELFALQIDHQRLAATREHSNTAEGNH